MISPDKPQIAHWPLGVVAAQLVLSQTAGVRLSCGLRHSAMAAVVRHPDSYPPNRPNALVAQWIERHVDFCKSVVEGEPIATLAQISWHTTSAAIHWCDYINVGGGCDACPTARRKFAPVHACRE